MGRASMPTVDSQRPSGPLTFLQPEEPETSMSSPSDLPSPDQLADPWPSSSPLDDENAAADPFDGPTSSRASSASSSLGKRSTITAARKAVLMAGEGAHQLLAHDEFDEQVDLYRTDEDDAKAIGDPLGAIVHRHGLLGGVANPDVMDGINALVGLGIYGWKQVERFRAARHLRKAQRAAQAAGTEQGDDPAPTAPVELDTPAWVNH